MRSGQGCVHTCTLPGEVYQVQQLLGSLRAFEVCDQPHSVRWRGSWIYLMCVFLFVFVFFNQFVSRFCLWNWSTSICHFYWLFDLSSARRFHCLLVGQPESVMSSVGCLLCGTREPDLLEAALSPNLIQTIACWVELVRKCFGIIIIIIIIKIVAAIEEASRAFI